MSDCASPWFAGLTCDHLFADCPNRMRGEAEMRRAGWWWDEHPRGVNDPFAQLDPHDGDVCGLCLHRHNRREHRETA